MEKLKISIMSGKLKGIRAINTNTLTNDFCQAMHKSKDKACICTKCYSHYMLKTFRKNCAKAFQVNSDLLKDIIPLENLPSIKDDVFRFHAHGELINENHLINFIGICRKNYKTIFTLWTKRQDIVKKVFSEWTKPKNLILVYSNPTVDKIILKIPEYFDKVFNVVTTDTGFIPPCGINCSDKCTKCLLCYTRGTDIIIEKIKNYTK